MCLIKDFKKYCDAVAKSFTKNYNYLKIVMNSDKLKHFLRGNQDI